MENKENLDKLTILMLELNLKIKEYNQLCSDLDALEESGIEGKSEELLTLKEMFSSNYSEIARLNKEIAKYKPTVNNSDDEN